MNRHIVKAKELQNLLAEYTRCAMYARWDERWEDCLSENCLPRPWILASMEYLMLMDVFPFKVFIFCPHLFSGWYDCYWVICGVKNLKRKEIFLSILAREKSLHELCHTSWGVPPSGTQSSPGLLNPSSRSGRNGGKSEIRHWEPSGLLETRFCCILFGCLFRLRCCFCFLMLCIWFCLCNIYSDIWN